MNAPKDSTRYLDRYLNELIDFGGELMTRADVIREMQSEGTDRACIDRWLQGYELGQRLRARREGLEVRLVLGTPVRRRRMTR